MITSMRKKETSSVGSTHEGRIVGVLMIYGRSCCVGLHRKSPTVAWWEGVDAHLFFRGALSLALFRALSQPVDPCGHTVMHVRPH